MLSGVIMMIMVYCYVPVAITLTGTFVHTLRQHVPSLQPGARERRARVQNTSAPTTKARARADSDSEWPLSRRDSRHSVMARRGRRRSDGMCPMKLL